MNLPAARRDSAIHFRTSASRIVRDSQNRVLRAVLAAGVRDVRERSGNAPSNGRAGRHARSACTVAAPGQSRPRWPLATGREQTREQQSQNIREQPDSFQTSTQSFELHAESSWLEVHHASNFRRGVSLEAKFYPLPLLVVELGELSLKFITQFRIRSGVVGTSRQR